RICIVEKVNRQLIGDWLAQGVGDELWPKRRTAYADQKQILKHPGCGLELPSMNLCGETFYALDCLLYFLTNGRGRREGRIAQPVMSDHPILVGIGDRTPLKARHGSESLLQSRFHRGKKIIGKVY